MPSPAVIRPTLSHAVHRTSGVRVPIPPMLSPREIDQVLAAARSRAKQRAVQHVGTPQPLVTPPVTIERVPAPGHLRGAAPAKGATRTTQSVQSSTGTGINPWWRYQEQNLPGGGRVMVNVGTGNLVLQDDDMSVAHKGISLAFRRTYNSQSQHDVAGSDGAMPGLYGNGWTNTFDAHLTGSSTGTITVWDIDGARYDYTLAADGITRLPPPGQHASLVYVGNCGYVWSKKSGTMYYFWGPDAASCPTGWWPTYGAYAGRTYQIIGRNRNTYITFSYSWDNGNSAPGGKISAISAQTESGLTATMSFADVSGNRLLQQIAFPDGVTSVSYGYDAQGNLASVSRPSNNASGNRPVQYFGYLAFGSGSVLQWAASPRWCAGVCGADGAFTTFGYGGGTVPTATVSAIWRGGVVNPVIPDGTGSGALQHGFSTGAYYYDQESYTTGVGTPTFRDTDGHATNWVVDSLGRPTQTQDCTATANQAAQCTGTWLVSTETWDSDNNLATEVDPRGSETYYLYDPRGNTTVVAGPYTTTSQGSFLPTKIFDYDANNNVVAYCDENEVHQAGVDYLPVSFSIEANDSLCASQMGSVPYWRATFTTPSWELAGELTSMTTPMGYTRTISYAPSQQTGIDYGLPTAVRGDPIAQSDGARTPFQSLTYDAAGNLVCSSSDGNDPTTTTVLVYDALNRVVAVGDPDDATITSSACAKTPGIAGSAIATRTTYFPNGQVATTQTPAEAAANVSTQFQYDLDGNVISEQRHYAPNAGPTQKWYDGADRLVEVRQPTDAYYDYYTFPWTTRYLYDLTQGGTVAIASSAPFHAYGGLFKTQELLPNGVTAPQWNEAGSAAGPSTGTSNPTWQDTAGTSFDALDRAMTAFRNTGTGLMPVTNTYDGPGNAGLLSQKCNANNECQAFTYDGRGATLQKTFNVPSSSTQNFSFDPDGRPVTASNGLGALTDIYDADGRKTSRQETVGATSATINYVFYGDGMRKSLDASSGTQHIADVLAYTYRPDGLLRQLGVASTYSFSFSYTGGRRLTSRSDTTGQAPDSFTYTGSGSPTSYGLAQSMTTPGFYETGMTYNAEGGQLGGSYYGFNGSGWFQGHLIQAAYTTRGEVVVDTSGPGVPSLYANGMRIQTARSPSDPKTGSFAFNAFQNMPVATQSASKCVQGTCDSSTWAYGYDPVGRQVTAQSSDYTNAKSYDAEDHLLKQTLPWIPWGKGGDQRSLGYQWGPIGHPLQVGSTSAVSSSNPPPTDFQYDTLVWDDDDLLFTLNSAGQIDDLKVADFADYVPGASNPLTVWDRDTNGQIYGCHTGGAASTVASSGFQQTTVACGSSSSFIGPQFAPNQIPVGRGGMLLIPKSDGFSDGQNTFEGVRTYDPQSGAWTTPDAFHGDVHDPMSQKPYMWNRNNPYAYADPSGYKIEFTGDVFDQLQGEHLVNEAIDYLTSKGDSAGASFLKNIRDNQSFTIRATIKLGGGENRVDQSTGQLYWDAASGNKVGKGVQSPTLALLHEAAHAYRFVTDRAGLEADLQKSDAEYGNAEERRVIQGIESSSARILGQPVRTNHGGDPCRVRAVIGTSCV